MVDKRELEELSTFQSGGYFVASLYLNVDGKRFNKKDYEIKLKDLIKQRNQELEQLGIADEARESLQQDFEKMMNYVSYEFDGRGAKSLAIFSCSALGLWKVFRLPQAVHPRLVVSKQPYIRPLAALLEENKRYLTVLISRDKARIFDYYMGELEEVTKILDEVPGKVRIAGWYGLAERRIERNIEDKVHRHFKHVADAVMEYSRKTPPDFYIIGGRRETLPEFERHLHTDILKRIVARIEIDPEAPTAEVREEVERAVEEYEEAEKKRLLEKLFEEAGANGLGVLGLKPTLKALWNGQVSVLFVTEDYVRQGYYCPECYYMSADETVCPYDGTEMKISHDIFEDAVETAILQNCEVVRVKDASVLEKYEHMGALLRFKL
ncbi:MAG TPA: hypothetical protein ENJ23_02225 [Bacteroidetes bacterium]|nr:hypothetical protein [Bacteroidota bacterium]